MISRSHECLMHIGKGRTKACAKVLKHAFAWLELLWHYIMLAIDKGLGQFLIECGTATTIMVAIQKLSLGVQFDSHNKCVAAARNVKFCTNRHKL